jgi:hypothetical protein
LRGIEVAHCELYPLAAKSLAKAAHPPTASPPRRASTCRDASGHRARAWQTSSPR